MKWIFEFVIWVTAVWSGFLELTGKFRVLRRFQVEVDVKKLEKVDKSHRKLLEITRLVKLNYIFPRLTEATLSAKQ